MNYTQARMASTLLRHVRAIKKAVVYFMRFLYVQAPYKPKHMIPIDACITISQNATELSLYLSFQATNLTDVSECCIRKHLLYHLHHLIWRVVQYKWKKAMTGLKVERIALFQDKMWHSSVHTFFSRHSCFSYRCGIINTPWYRSRHSTHRYAWLCRWHDHCWTSEKKCVSTNTFWKWPRDLQH